MPRVERVRPGRGVADAGRARLVSPVCPVGLTRLPGRAPTTPGHPGSPRANSSDVSSMSSRQQRCGSDVACGTGPGARTGEARGARGARGIRGMRCGAASEPNAARYSTSFSRDATTAEIERRGWAERGVLCDSAAELPGLDSPFPSRKARVPGRSRLARSENHGDGAHQTAAPTRVAPYAACGIPRPN